jgi:molybdopterin/thiamine biosynthesis adenylyltransferase
MSTVFDYDKAFGRNLGWFTSQEQSLLRSKRVAIAGLGGCGGAYVTTLARLGVGAFTLSDFDKFELANFNRQAGAKVSTIGQPKLDVLRAMALDINPDLDIRAFPEGLNEANIDAFLDGADVFLDAIDVFSIETRRAVHARCRARGIPAILSAPAGMGAAFLIFMPGGGSLEDWFRFADVEPSRRIVNFIIGMGPAALHRSYLMDWSKVNLATHDFPSTGLAVELCAGVTAAQAAKILLGRGPIEAVPCYHHFDAYKCVYRKGRIRGGNSNWLQRLKLKFANREFDRLSQAGRSEAIPGPAAA